MDDPTEVVVTDEVADSVAGDVEEELLVEEISIDGMCGVY
jgi:mycofactocin precursor